jgi:chromosome segregation ATPase
MAPKGSDRESIERRLAAVERALADEEPFEYTDRLDDIEGRVTELEAAVQALRGYVGSVRAVNEDVEQRADLAVRKVSVLERELTARSEEAASDRAETNSTADGPLGRLREWR